MSCCGNIISALVGELGFEFDASMMVEVFRKDDA